MYSVKKINIRFGEDGDPQERKTESTVSQFTISVGTDIVNIYNDPV
jgi:hypothetical protein